MEEYYEYTMNADPYISSLEIVGGAGNGSDPAYLVDWEAINNEMLDDMNDYYADEADKKAHPRIVVVGAADDIAVISASTVEEELYKLFGGDGNADANHDGGQPTNELLDDDIPFGESAVEKLFDIHDVLNPVVDTDEYVHVALESALGGALV